MTEEERKRLFVDELDYSDNIDTQKWCENCKYSHAFLMDGIGMCRKQDDRFCFYCGTCIYFESK